VTERTRPAMFVWTEPGMMVPEARFLPLCRRQFKVGEGYALGPVENVASRSRGGLFAALREAWGSLPEEDSRFPTPEHLRAWALVRAGHAAHAQYVLDTPKDARQMARGLRRASPLAIIKISGSTVDCWTALSIASTEVKAEQFAEIKKRVLKILAELIGTTQRELEEQSRDGGGR
jgi:hypothetical protein